MLLHAKRYWSETITAILWPYSLKDFAGQLNVLNMDEDGINPMENVSVTTTDITLKITTRGDFQLMS